jgi:hypothetical protein
MSQEQLALPTDSVAHLDVDTDDESIGWESDSYGVEDSRDDSGAEEDIEGADGSEPVEDIEGADISGYDLLLDDPEDVEYDDYEKANQVLVAEGTTASAPGIAREAVEDDGDDTETDDETDTDEDLPRRTEGSRIGQLLDQAKEKRVGSDSISWYLAVRVLQRQLTGLSCLKRLLA